MLGRHPDVGGQGQLGRARARLAVQRADDDLGQRLDGVEETVGTAHERDDLVLGEGRAEDRIQDAGREEFATGAGEDHRLRRLVPREAVHDALQLGEDLRTQAVLPRRVVQRDGHDRAVPGGPHSSRVGHGRALLHDDRTTGRTCRPNSSTVRTGSAARLTLNIRRSTPAAAAARTCSMQSSGVPAMARRARR